MDLCTPEATILVGPHALGYVFGAFVVVQVRTMVFRRRLLTISLLTTLLLIAAAMVVVCLFTVRSWYPQPPAAWAEYHPVVEWLRLVGAGIYSGLLALPLGWLLIQTFPMWSFQVDTERRWAVR